MNFQEIFEIFMERKNNLKVVHAATCGADGKPNSAPKLLVEITAPNQVYFRDNKLTQSFSNLQTNPAISLSVMDDTNFTGYRLTGTCEILESGPELEWAREIWEKRLISYEAERMIKRVTGGYSTKESESSLPQDFVLIKVTASEAAVVKPGRIVRAVHYEKENQT